jgi:hypothetical protein
MSIKKLEYAASGGPGTLLVLGVTDNRHTVKAHVALEVLRSAACDVLYPKVSVLTKPVPSDKPVGTR